MVYASETLALATLETLVHYDESLGRRRRLVLCVAEIPSDIAVEEAPATLFTGRWRSYPAPRRLAQYGDAWVHDARTAVLRVRSAVLPRERNLLLNPSHPDFRRLRLQVLEPFQLDSRLL